VPKVATVSARVPNKRVDLLIQLSPFSTWPEEQGSKFDLVVQQIALPSSVYSFSTSLEQAFDAVELKLRAECLAEAAAQFFDKLRGTPSVRSQFKSSPVCSHSEFWKRPQMQPI
jgi:hypothetical protein